MITINRLHFKRFIQHLICEEISKKLIVHDNHDASNRPSEFNETNSDNTGSRYRIWSMAEWEKIIEDSDGLDSLPPVKLKVKLTFGETQIPYVGPLTPSDP